MKIVSPIVLFFEEKISQLDRLFAETMTNEFAKTLIIAEEKAVDILIESITPLAKVSASLGRELGALYRKDGYAVNVQKTRALSVLRANAKVELEYARGLIRVERQNRKGNGFEGLPDVYIDNTVDRFVKEIKKHVSRFLYETATNSLYRGMNA